MDITREAIDRLVELGHPTLEEVAGRTYSSKQLVPVKEPMPGTIGLRSLLALADFLLWEFPSGRADLIAEVSSPTFVVIHGRLEGAWEQRASRAQAQFEEGTKFPFGQYVSQETFLIGMQVGFVPDETTAKLLQLIGTVQDSKVLNLKDDGLTQQVTASAGLAKVGLVDLPNPVQLRPYRTFAEVEQPASKFIVRARSGQGETVPSFALFEVEDPTWRREARAFIANYLATKVKDLTVLY